jgi:hypothetical protein
MLNTVHAASVPQSSKVRVIVDRDAVYLRVYVRTACSDSACVITPFVHGQHYVSLMLLHISTCITTTTAITAIAYRQSVQ